MLTPTSSHWQKLAACLLLALLTACSSTKKGGYYKDDGPDANPPAYLDKVPDAVPKIEPLASGANKPYTLFGKAYRPDTSGGPYKVQGRASWYGKKFHGNPTSNGERYDMYAMTAAHTTLPIPSYVRVTRVSNGKSIVLRINDRGPFHSDRIIDLSYVAAYKLGMLGPGSSEVVVERIMPDQIRNWQTQPTTTMVADQAPVAPAAVPTKAVQVTAVPVTALAMTNSAGMQNANTASGEQTSLQSSRLPVPLDPPPATRPEPVPAKQLQSSAENFSLQEARPVPASSMFLQLGAFSDPAKAQSLAAQVTQKIPAGLDAQVLVDQSANNLYRVRIGPFASREAAVQALTPIQNSTGVAPSLSLP
jgi:rare lipoprotein A